MIVEEGGGLIVMQYVDGETLADLVRRGPLEPRLAVTIACALADALSAAHKRGVIHRDIKPQNVMVSGERHVKLLDFGIARVAELTTDGVAEHDGASLTSAGMFLGTLRTRPPSRRSSCRSTDAATCSRSVRSCSSA